MILTAKLQSWVLRLRGKKVCAWFWVGVCHAANEGVLQNTTRLLSVQTGEKPADYSAKPGCWNSRHSEILVMGIHGSIGATTTISEEDKGPLSTSCVTSCCSNVDFPYRSDMPVEPEGFAQGIDKTSRLLTIQETVPGIWRHFKSLLVPRIPFSNPPWRTALLSPSHGLVPVADAYRSQNVKQPNNFHYIVLLLVIHTGDTSWSINQINA